MIWQVCSKAILWSGRLERWDGLTRKSDSKTLGGDHMQQQNLSLSGPHRLVDGRAPGYATMVVAPKGDSTPQSRGATIPALNAAGRQVVVKQ